MESLHNDVFEIEISTVLFKIHEYSKLNSFAEIEKAIGNII